MKVLILAALIFSSGCGLQNQVNNLKHRAAELESISAASSANELAEVASLESLQTQINVLKLQQQVLTKQVQTLVNSINQSKK